MGDSFRVGIDDQPTRLVTTGPFRLVRNPIFSALLISLGGFTLLAPAAWTVMGFLASSLLLAIQTRLEERHLVKLHGEPYMAYSARVGRFFPGVGLLSRGAGQ
jgi:protein-S-isoprenylcysteine O-methyltransferase Ste14